jgi:hypothetical protein
MGRKRRCQDARRRATDAIERQAELRLTDSRFDPVRDIRRVDDNDVSADRLELGHEFRARQDPVAEPDVLPTPGPTASTLPTPSLPMTAGSGGRNA